MRDCLLGTRGSARALLLAAAVLSLSGGLLRAQAPVTYFYDALGRLAGVVNGNGESAVYVYDAVGNLLAIERHSSGTVGIVQFTPSSGPIATTVTISGTGFSTTPSQNTLTFNGVAATVTGATATQLVATVPSGATTGTIAVTTPSGSATSGGHSQSRRPATRQPSRTSRQRLAHRERRSPSPARTSRPLRRTIAPCSTCATGQ